MVEEAKQFINSPTMNTAVLGMQSMLQQNMDIRSGKNAIHANKTTYFSKLDDQNDDQFKTMVEMAPVYILYPKVVDGFVGTIFSKDPKMMNIEFTDKQKVNNKNVDLLGNSINKFSENVVSEVIENGFCATMNDYSDSLKRPFMRMVKSNQFVSMRTHSDDGYPKISQFIFYEEIDHADPTDEFLSISKNQYTVLDLAPNPSNGGKENYRVRILEAISENKVGVNSNEVGEQCYVKSEMFPKKNGEYFDKLPLTLHGVDANNFTIKKSLLQDISDMNISVMQRVVDQVYMLHWTALPTPWITGSDGDDSDSPDTIGPSKIWHISNPEAKVGMLEFTGQSARAHQDYIENLLYIMATTGAQILKKEGVSRETATSVLVRTASQTSLVGTMVKNVSGQLQTALEVFFEWSDIVIPNDFQYLLNDDFIKVDMEPNAQIALVKSWLDGALSHKSMFKKMKEGELIEANKTFEEELEEIVANPPPFFEAKQKAKLDAAAAKIVGEQGGDNTPPNKDDMKGSNLENGNIDNPQATE